MKTRIYSIIFAALLVCSLAVPTYADHIDGGSGWKVEFTTNEKLESNFSSNQYADVIGQLQPGDDVTITVHLQNVNPHTVDWYMANEVISTLEESYARTNLQDGAYEYLLTYSGPGGDQVLYSSSTVGGDKIAGNTEREGLKEATDALEDFFFLDTIAPNQTAVVYLTVSLDGETQDNAFMTTFADLKMNFAVELREIETETNPPTRPDIPTIPTNPDNPTTEPETETTTDTPEPTTTPGENETTTPVSPEGPTTTPGGGENGTTTGGDASRTTVVKTGDNSPLMILYIVMGVSGLAFLILAIDSIRRRRRFKKEHMR